jgi:long-chain acyl-CoA synthetase
LVEVAAGLAGLGVGRGDFVALMMGNRVEHVIADQAAVYLGAVPTTFYGTLAPEQIRYCAAHCAAKVAVLEDRDVAKRWQDVRDDLPALQRVVVVADAPGLADAWPSVLGWDELLVRGRESMAAEPARVAQIRTGVRPEDPVTLIYTSGTTGPPKGVILTHRNLLYECAALDRAGGLPDGLATVSYLPLAHIAERLGSIYNPLWKHGQVYLCPDLTQVFTYVRHVRPIAFATVPRLLEKLWAGLTATLDATEPRRRKLVHAAIATGRDVVRRQQRGDRVPVALRARHALLDWLVLAKIRASVGLDRCRLLSCGAAPLAIEVAESFAALGLPVYEVYGMTETSAAATGNRPGVLRIGTVGPPGPGIELTLAADGEVLLRGPINTPATTANRRKRPNCSTPTAGCTPATSAPSMTMGTYASSTAGRS